MQSTEETLAELRAVLWETGMLAVSMRRALRAAVERERIQGTCRLELRVEIVRALTVELREQLKALRSG